MKYRKDNITLQIRVPAEMAIYFLGRMYGKGLITREQYIARVKNIDRGIAERAEMKNKVFERLIKESRKFYKKEVANKK